MKSCCFGIKIDEEMISLEVKEIDPLKRRDELCVRDRPASQDHLMSSRRARIMASSDEGDQLEPISGYLI